ncbi:F-box/WD repeat-containing protein [Criblamydia sequanensis]|uniref:F-box and WD repeat-containing protein n=1 Tax=Candidatus Criblamydia sequanensis CRIB-18 TaxID=1437425 RepID=A0A090CYF8_9BACT|nr:F-box/WD40 repeat-containing protein [Criblamydia sequanensis]CDR33567.1 F-box and WD repeat-containing protein [Criblamydia sequanensis CRIB-18]
MQSVTKHFFLKEEKDFHPLEFFEKIIPDELLVSIFTHLNPNEIKTISLVSRRWLWLAKEKSLWQLFFRRNFPDSAKEEKSLITKAFFFETLKKNERLLKNDSRPSYKNRPDLKIRTFYPCSDKIIIATGKEIHLLNKTTLNTEEVLSYHEEEIDFVYEKDKKIYSVDKGGKVKIFDLAVKNYQTIETENRIEFCQADQSFLYLLDSSGVFKRLSLEKSHELEILEISLTRGASILIHKGLLYYGKKQGGIEVISLKEGKLKRSFETSPASSFTVFGNKLYVSLNEGTVSAFDRKKGTLLFEWRAHKRDAKYLTFYNDTLFSASFDGTLKLWDKGGVFLKQFELPFPISDFDLVPITGFQIRNYQLMIGSLLTGLSVFDFNL